jgi:hypothetical protein
VISRYRIAVSAALILILGAATSLAEEAINLNSPIVACYLAQSAIAGATKCDQPSTLVGAVFGRCDKEEQAIRDKILNSGGDGYDRQNVADIALRRIHERMGPVIQGWILGAQVGSPACPKTESGPQSK